MILGTCLLSASVYLSVYGGACKDALKGPLEPLPRPRQRNKEGEGKISCSERAGHAAQVESRQSRQARLLWWIQETQWWDSCDLWAKAEPCQGTCLLGAAMISAFSKNSGLVLLHAFLLYISCMPGPGLSPPVLKKSWWGVAGAEGSCPTVTRQ